MMFIKWLKNVLNMIFKISKSIWKLVESIFIFIIAETLLFWKNGFLHNLRYIWLCLLLYMALDYQIFLYLWPSIIPIKWLGKIASTFLMEVLAPCVLYFCKNFCKKLNFFTINDKNITFKEFCQICWNKTVPGLQFKVDVCKVTFNPRFVNCWRVIFIASGIVCSIAIWWYMV
jgi:hypothetical protein